MKNIIIISGKQYSGKDTLAKILLQKLEGFRRIGIGDSIKIEYGKRNNLSFDEIEKNKHLYRADLIKLGNWGRVQDKNFWLKNLASMEKIIVPDIRVQDEVEFFKSNKQREVLLVRVESPVEMRAQRGIIVESNDNTETNLDNYGGWDIVVNNDSTLEKLYLEADRVIELM